MVTSRLYKYFSYPTGITTKSGSWIVITLAMLLSKYSDQGCDFLQRCLMVGVMPLEQGWGTGKAQRDCIIFSAGHIYF